MKKLFIKILSYLGYGIVKVNRKPFIKRDQVIIVGKYQLSIPPINPLIFTYKNNNDFSGEIGRLVICICEKYPQMKIFDVGANIGDTAAAIKSIREIPLVCIEGDPFTYSYLLKNSEKFKDVVVYNNYLSDKDDMQTIKLEKEGWNTTLIPQKDGGRVIQFLKLDTLISKEMIDRIAFKFLKIDTEGYDTIILRGALEYISSAQPVIFLEYNIENMRIIHEDGLSAVLKLRDFGYEKTLFYDDGGRFILSSTLANDSLIRELSNYADGKDGLITYYNICFFHQNDSDIAENVIIVETNRNLS